MLAPHASAVEYWFFKVNTGATAILVDWIARRRQNEHVLRVSIHSSTKRGVFFGDLPSPMIDGRCFLTTRRTVGQLDDIAWELDITCDEERVEPISALARYLRM